MKKQPIKNSPEAKFLAVVFLVISLSVFAFATYYVVRRCSLWFNGRPGIAQITGSKKGKNKYIFFRYRDKVNNETYSTTAEVRHLEDFDGRTTLRIVYSPTFRGYAIADEEHEALFFWFLIYVLIIFSLRIPVRVLLNKIPETELLRNKRRWYYRKFRE